MTPIRFVHAADLHIDSPFAGVREVDKRVADRLRDSTFEAFQKLVQLCIDERVDFVLIAGDVFDGADRSVRAQLRFRDGLAKLADEGIQAYVVHGNHDPLDGWQSAVSWPDGVHIFGPEPEWKIILKDGQPAAAVQGVSFPTQIVEENLVERFSPPVDQELFSIGLLHCNVGGNSEHSNYAPCTVDDLKLSGLDYWALGHVHTRQTLRRSGPAIVYPGNTQGRNPNETGPRGCLVVEVADDGVPKMEFRALDVVRWETASVSIEKIDTIDGLVAAIEQQLDDISAKAEGRDVISRVILTGRGPMHAELARPGSLDDLLETVRASSGAATPWVWVERLADETRAELDMESRLQADDFLGAVLRRAAAASESSADAERLTAAVGEVFTGRRNGLPAATADNIETWTDEARWYLAELLEPES